MNGDSSFATWLRRQLARREWTQADFARRLNLSPQIVSRWTRGERTPSPAYCDLIADALAVDLDLVLWQAGHRPMTERLDPDDPLHDIIGLAERIHWKDDPGNVRLVTGVLRTILSQQKAKPA